MKLGLSLGYFTGNLADDFTLIDELESLGFDSVWTAEAYGLDAATPLGFIAARTSRIKIGSGILQMPARTPAMTAMTAVTLDKLSGGRFLLGLGLSGPQVVEGWHGVPYGKPIGKTREYVSILRKIFARDEPVTHEGAHYQLPYTGDGASGLGKPLKMIDKPIQEEIPIYVAAIGPKNVALTAEIADGWLPIFFSPERFRDIWGDSLDTGFAAAGDGKADRFDIAPSVFAQVTSDLDVARMQAKPMLALYIGGMGAKGRNFYNDLACRYGYEEAATTVQDLYLAGKKREATMAVPDELVDDVSLIGSKEQIADRLAAWREAGVGTLILNTMDLATIRTVAEVAG
ncbi:MAG: LLM class F420-dependent oxidoreductase [Acidimicrobiia bacterium]|nr:LLM class F420-dependent oxidoreductase [Acidimicrobiia bacterium]NNC75962.1 LLM class F420-dependent oxidoreductase [Acidimicrobiia bacterium]